MPTEHMAHLKFHFYVGFHVHDSIVVAVPPVPCKLPHIAVDILQGLFLNEKPSVDIFTNRIEPTLGMLGLPLMGRLTDSGFVVPHFSIPMNNSLLPLTILFGSSLSLLGSSSVKVKTSNPIPFLGGVEDSDTAANLIPWAPISLNLACSDPVPLPTDLVVAPDNVMVGVTWADWISALIDFAIEFTLAVVMEVAGALFDTLKKAAKKGGKKALKKGTSAVDDAVSQAVKSGLDGKLGFKMWTESGREAVEKAAREAGEKAAREAGEKAAKEAAEKVAKEAAEKAVEEGAARVVEEGAAAAAAKLTKEAAEEAAEKATKEFMAHAFEQPLSGKLVKRYVTGSVLDITKSFGGTISEGIQRGDLLGFDLGAGLTEPVKERVSLHPSVTMTSPDTIEDAGDLLANRSPIHVDVAFGKSVTGFAVTDIVATDSTVSDFQGSGRDYSFKLTPGAGARSVRADIPVGAAHYQESSDWYKDLFSLDSARYPNRPGQFTCLYESDRPTVALESTVAGSTKISVIPMVARFNMDVEDFDATKVRLSRGSVTNWRPVDKKEYRFDADFGGGDGEVTAGIAENVAHTRFGNGNHPSATFRRTIDTTPPTVQVSREFGPISSRNPVDFHVTFSEDVRFGAEHVEARRGDQQLGVTRFQRNSGSDYVVEVEVPSEGEVELTVPARRVADLAGNLNSNEGHLVALYHPMGALHPDSRELDGYSELDKESMSAGAAIMGETSA